MNQKLINAVIKQLQPDNKEEFLNILRDVVCSGACAGFHGFIYTNKTVKFYLKNRKLIRAELSELADDTGNGIFKIVQSFGCLTDRRTNKSAYSEEEIAQTLFGKPSEVDPQIANALAWFALEEVARHLTEEG